VNRRVTVFIILFVFFLSIYAAIAFYTTTPKPSQPFIGFGIYSQQGTLSGYTGPNSIINVNQTLDWTFNITNRMGSTQFVQIVTRIGNNETTPPNAIGPALLPVLTNSTLFVANGSTFLKPFTWKVLNVTLSGGLEYLRLDMNGLTLNSTLGNPPGNQFRFFFEVWTFNNSSGTFQYYTWLQVWFTVH
jgi:hypothetical protein